MSGGNRLNQLARGILDGIVDDGVSFAVKSLAGTVAGREDRRLANEAAELRERILQRISSGDARQLFDDYESGINGRHAIRLDFCYAQGLSDGVALAAVLLGGRLVPWLADAYPAPEGGDIDGR